MDQNSPFATSPVFSGGFFTPESFNVLYLGGLKVIFLLVFLLYATFSLVVIRQVFLMEQTINTPLHIPLKIFSIAHFVVAVFLLLLAFLAL